MKYFDPFTYVYNLVSKLWKFLSFVKFTIPLFLEYMCSKENICSEHGQCMDGGWCLCRPGWSSKEDCSGSFIFRKIFDNYAEFCLSPAPYPVSSHVLLSSGADWFHAYEAFSRCPKSQKWLAFEHFYLQLSIDTRNTT